jgi:hypothetical protein
MLIKLLLCRQCADIFRIGNTVKHCQCEASKAQYLSPRYIAISGPSVVIGIPLDELMLALNAHDQAEQNTIFNARILETADNTILRPKSNKPGHTAANQVKPKP